MYSISWLLYIIDVLGGVKVLALFVAGTFSVILVGGIITIPASEGETWEWFSRNFRWLIGAPIIAWAIFIGVPRQSTLYAIAASEVGERIIKNDKVQDLASDATKALHQWIKNQIESKPEK